MTPKRKKAREKRLRQIARNEVQKNTLRLWYRIKYNLTPNDPRYLGITDKEILKDFYLHDEYHDLQREFRLQKEYSCKACDYIGDPAIGTLQCPKCGAEMNPPKMGDQAAIFDDNIFETIKEVTGHELSQTDKDLIEGK